MIVFNFVSVLVCHVLLGVIHLALRVLVVVGSVSWSGRLCSLMLLCCVVYIVCVFVCVL